MFRLPKQFLLSVFFLSGFFLFYGDVFASGNISGSAWSNQEGYINFGCGNCNANVNNNLTLTGYGWSSNFGWVNLAPTNGGVKTDSSGNLSGLAWSSSRGWINFSGVIIDALTGAFTGNATGYNGNSETINFECQNCSVSTTWRPSPVSSSSVTGGGGGSLAIPVKSAGVFSILINNGNSYTNSTNVVLKFQAGLNVTKMLVSNSQGFENATPEDYTATKNWVLTPGDGQKNVYAKFYTDDGNVYNVVSEDIILDTVAPSLKITNIKQKYNPAEEVIIGGTTSEGNVGVVMLIGGQYGAFNSDSAGQWLATFGKMPVGNYHIEITPKDLAQNAGNSMSVDFSVEESAPLPTTPQPSILDKIKVGLEFLVPGIKKPPVINPVKVVTVPKIAPVALKNVWIILPVDKLSRFVLAPLPKNIAVLAQKFPEISKTFENVGVTRASDVDKLKSANLRLPGLSQAIGLKGVEISPGKFAIPKGIPIANLSALAKSKIPSDIVFAKVGGGLVDLDIALSLNNQGQTEQRISTIVGKPLQLTFKVDKPAKNVFGYVVFKSKNKSKSQSVSAVSLNSLTASLSFADPNFINKFDSTKYAFSSVKNNGLKELVLAKFAYQDTGSGIYTATLQTPTVEGEYEVITVVNYQDLTQTPEEISLITIVDPEGYIYEKNGDMETRIGGAVISLYWLNPQTKKYELWQASDYQQENPQTTDVRGTYSFLVPQGYYYLKVDAPGYLSYNGKPFEVREGDGVHTNIELKGRNWWIKIVDWKMVVLISVMLLLFYNFYKDRMREKIIKEQK